MSGKGHERRPQSVDDKTFSDNWSRIFDGARLGADTASNTGNVGSIPTAPANSEVMEDFRRFWDGQAPRAKDAHGAFSCVYIDNATGQEVSEDWWPGDEI